MVLIHGDEVIIEQSFQDDSDEIQVGEGLLVDDVGGDLRCGHCVVFSDLMDCLPDSQG